MSEFVNGKQSPWGYIYDSETLPDLINTTEFAQFTNGKYGTTDARILPNIASASAAIRNFCGWHIAPSLDCGMLYNVHDLRDAFVGPDLLIQLPATFVTKVIKVVIGAVWDEDAGDWKGEIIDAERIDAGMGDGLVRIYDVGHLDRKAKIFIKYTAGFTNDAIAAVKELAAASVVRALTNTHGVVSEAAGGVSVSYNATWSGKGSTALVNDARDVLDVYKVRRVF